jgi:hypothetical protein
MSNLTTIIKRNTVCPKAFEAVYLELTGELPEGTSHGGPVISISTEQMHRYKRLIANAQKFGHVCWEKENKPYEMVNCKMVKV